jgi:hypothetical protein
LTKLQEVEEEFEQAQELKKTMKSYQASLEISREERLRMHNIRDMIKKKEAGLVKTKKFNPRTRSNILATGQISKASAKQGQQFGGGEPCTSCLWERLR